MKLSPNSIVRTAANHEPVAILETRDATLVPVECPHKLATRRVPHLDGSVSACRHDVFFIKVHNVNGGSMADKHPTERDLCLRWHVPHCYRPILCQTKQWVKGRTEKSGNMFGEHWVRLFKETGDKGYGRVIRRGRNINGQQIKKRNLLLSWKGIDWKQAKYQSKYWIK